MRMADHRAEYEGVLRRYTAPLRRLASSYVGDPAGRDDLFQELAMALWTALPRFRGDCSERTWVYRVAHNTAISFVASRRRRDGREQQSEVEREPAAAAHQEGDAIERQRRERLWAAVQELPIAERQIIVLHLEGLSAAEIEAITGVNAGAVATRLTRIRQKLAARLRVDPRVDPAPKETKEKRS
jgi:RNA polymerase sigma factor (sigma-70 family)